MKIGVVMAVYLGKYDGAATNREFKFLRAVRSFLDQPYINKELIIVSDGCDMAEALYRNHFSNYPEIKFTKIKKQPLLAGIVRNTGIAMSVADIISYLDSDDILFGDHLSDIVHKFSFSDWVYFNDYVALDAGLEKKRMRGAAIEYGCIGTSAIAHRRPIDVKWTDGYSHDWKFVTDLNEKYPNGKNHITATGYCVCHVPPILDV